MKLQKLHEKIHRHIEENELKFTRSRMTDRDKRIIHSSPMGTYYHRFNERKLSKLPLNKFKNLFHESNILSGVQPYLLYFNMPDRIIDAELLPERLIIQN